MAGANWQDPGYALYITGNHYQIDHIIIEHAAKGLVLDNANHARIQNVEIREIGQEALHVRDGSSHTLIDGVHLHDIGKINDGFGEGIYIGSDNSTWADGDGVNTGEKGKLYDKQTNHTIVRNSIIGPHITAEPFDIKEGVSHTLIEGNTIYAAGISGANSADSHMDIKAYNTIIRNNVFKQGPEPGNDVVDRSVSISNREKAGVDPEWTAHHIYVYDNEFHLREDVLIGRAAKGSSEVYFWNNRRIPESRNRFAGPILDRAPEDRKQLDRLLSELGQTRE